MAPKLPRPLARRDELYGPDTPRERLIALGHANLERGLVFDAADFFAEARDREGLETIRGRARETRDAFLLRTVQMADRELVSGSDWDELARRAKELGKDVYADRAEAGGMPPPPPYQEEEKPGLPEAEEQAGDQAAKKK